MKVENLAMPFIFASQHSMTHTACLLTNGIVLGWKYFEQDIKTRIDSIPAFSIIRWAHVICIALDFSMLWMKKKSASKETAYVNAYSTKIINLFKLFLWFIAITFV